MANTVKTQEKEKQKKGFKMPHLFWIMIILLLLSSLMTYIIPAGQFAVDESGAILGDQFEYLPEQTPVSPIGALYLLHGGLVSSGAIGYLVLMGGAMTAMLLGTGAVDELMNWAIYKLRNKSPNILIGSIFCVMVYLGAFGGNDSMIAIVPIGILFAKKVKMDPVVAMGVSTFATLIGFGTGPTKGLTTQLMMGVEPYSYFFTAFISLNLFMLIGLFFVIQYCNKIRKDPSKSLMWDEGWRPEQSLTAEEEEAMQKETVLRKSTIAIVFVYLAQFPFVITAPNWVPNFPGSYAFITGVQLIIFMILGFLGGFSFDKIGQTFAKGTSNMAFVIMVIGLATVMSRILTEGNIIHTIVYTLTQPLLDLSQGVASVGITAVIGFINVFIPSASAKVAILVPILRPVYDALGMMRELGALSFQFGDGFTNIISPMLGWTVGSLALVGLPYNKWLKWAVPKVLTFVVVSWIFMYCITTMGWQPF